MKVFFALIVLCATGCQSQVKPKPSGAASTSHKSEAKKVNPECEEGTSADGRNNYRPSDWYTCKGGKWIKDQGLTDQAEADRKSELEKMDKAEAHRKALIWALRTRVLTDAEWTEVEEKGVSILNPVNTWYTFSGDWRVVTPGSEEANIYYKEKQFNDLILQQVKLRSLQVPKNVQGKDCFGKPCNQVMTEERLAYLKHSEAMTVDTLGNVMEDLAVQVKVNSELRKRITELEHQMKNVKYSCMWHNQDGTK